MNNKYLDGGSTMIKSVIAIGKPAERKMSVKNSVVAVRTS